VRSKTHQAAKAPSKKRKQVPKEVFECSATYCQATCTEDDGDGWLQCDYCDTWVCSKRGCKRFLVSHEESCDFCPDE
jgi:hypothetical protein